MQFNGQTFACQTVHEIDPLGASEAKYRAWGVPEDRVQHILAMEKKFHDDWDALLAECERMEKAGEKVEDFRTLSAALKHPWINTPDCRLTADGAPLSFFWRNKNGICGGIIFHGRHDNGGDGGAPTFSVNLSPCTGWVIHT